MGTLVPAWFDPAGNHLVRICPLAPPEVVQAMRDFSPLAGILGILPMGADWVLGWYLAPGGVWCKRSLAETRTLSVRVQVELVAGAADLWLRRCREFESYWSTEAARPHVGNWEADRADKVLRARSGGVGADEGRAHDQLRLVLRRDAAVLRAISRAGSPSTGIARKPPRSFAPPWWYHYEPRKGGFCLACLMVQPPPPARGGVWTGEPCNTPSRHGGFGTRTHEKQAAHRKAVAVVTGPAFAPPPGRFPRRDRKKRDFLGAGFRDNGGGRDYIDALIGSLEARDYARSERTPFRWF